MIGPVLQLEDLRAITGHTRQAELERYLDAQGIPFKRGKAGIWTTLDALNAALGECPAMWPLNDENMEAPWQAALSIWDEDFNDSSLVAQWFNDAGATVIDITHTLYDTANNTRDGREFGNTRAWLVSFYPPKGKVN